MTAMAMKDASVVPARLSLGATMLYHGAAKLRGESARQSTAFFEQLGLHPAARWAKLAGLAEVFAGATAILGIGTRLGALAILATQGVAVAKVHRGKGFDATAGGWEFNALLVAVALGLLAAGPGEVSAHEAVERRLEGGWRSRLQPRRRRAVWLTKLLK
jgi:putative oxidoreductase